MNSLFYVCLLQRRGRGEVAGWDSPRDWIDGSRRGIQTFQSYKFLVVIFINKINVLTK